MWDFPPRYEGHVNRNEVTDVPDYFSGAAVPTCALLSHVCQCSLVPKRKESNLRKSAALTGWNH